MADKNRLYYGDNLQILREYVADQSVDLIYLHPPFNSRQEYSILFAGGRRQHIMRAPHTYLLTDSEQARIQCTAPGIEAGPLSRCITQAVFGQNSGNAPFWYHCEKHAEMWRTLGRVRPTTIAADGNG